MKAVCRHRPANRPGVPTRKTTPVMCSNNRCPELLECACAPFPWLPRPSAPTVALVAVSRTIATTTVASLPHGHAGRRLAIPNGQNRASLLPPSPPSLARCSVQGRPVCRLFFKKGIGVAPLR